MPTTPNKPDPEALAEKLEHKFASPSLLEEALTHPSLSGTRQRKKGAPYERLEFLGDRVLGLAIAEWIYETFPNADEGEMAKRHAALVNRDALRSVALEIGLAQFVRLARGEDADASRKNIATLPDAMEAVIGALYLDGGLAAAKKFIHRYTTSAYRCVAADLPGRGRRFGCFGFQSLDGGLQIFTPIEPSGLRRSRRGHWFGCRSFGDRPWRSVLLCPAWRRRRPWLHPLERPRAFRQKPA